MERLTGRTRNFDGTGFALESLTSDGRANLSAFTDKVLTKLADYEDAEEQCIKECGCGLNMVIQKYKEFLEHMHELAEYWELEEQGLLLKPKVALGSFVYWDSGYWGIIPYKVCNISYSIHGFCYEICVFKGDELLDDQEVVDDDFGKYVFLTKEEAEKKLAEMRKE